MELHDAIIDFLSVFPEGNPMIIKNKISNYSDETLKNNLYKLLMMNNDNYVLYNITHNDSQYNHVYYLILGLIYKEVMSRMNNTHSIAPTTLSIDAVEFVPNVYVSNFTVHKLNSNSIKHIKNMINNPFNIKHKKPITIDDVLLNKKIIPTYNRDIMIQLIKSSDEFSYDDSSRIIRIKN
jgi:hypothetical protein